MSNALKNLNSKPQPIAIPKLNRVPIRTYSVSLRFLPSVKSPNLNTDLAVMRNPMADQVLSKIKVNTNKRSRIPMIFPAPASEVLFAFSFFEAGSIASCHG